MQVKSGPNCSACATTRNAQTILTFCEFFRLAFLPSQQTQSICITFVQCWTNVEDVGPTLYKCYTNGLHCTPAWALLSQALHGSVPPFCFCFFRLSVDEVALAWIVTHEPSSSIELSATGRLVVWRTDLIGEGAYEQAEYYQIIGLCSRFWWHCI